MGSLQEQLTQYYTYQKTFFLRNEIYGTVSWDNQINVPAASKSSKNEIFSLLDKQIHSIQTNKEHVKLVNELYEKREQFDAQDQRSLQIAKKVVDQQTKLPDVFVEEFSRVKQEAQQAFQLAKKQEDREVFAPSFQLLIETHKQYATYVDPSMSPFDLFLDQNEEGMTSKHVDRLFDSILPTLTSLTEKCSKKPIELYQVDYDKHTFYACLQDLIEKIGFDTTKGLLGVMDGYSFAINLGPQDERINFHYQGFRDTLMSVLHELGHGLYEQAAHRRYPRTNLAGGVSLSIHESQARMLENMIVRTKPFVDFVFKHIDGYFPGVFGYTPDEIYQYVTHVTALPRRIGSDEITYNLHVLLRYEIERGLFNGTISVKDVPVVWNEKMREYLGIVPVKMTDGCLQDVHRSLGLFGYFPTYTLGNMVAAQLFASFIKNEPSREAQLVTGDFSAWKERFSTHIREKGSLVAPAQLIKEVTGEELKADAFIGYLTEKYGA